MKTDNNKQAATSKAIKWWENTVLNDAERVEWKVKLTHKYFGDYNYTNLTDAEILYIHKAENSLIQSNIPLPTDNSKEETVKGKEVDIDEWALDKNHIVYKNRKGLIIASFNLFRNNWEESAKKTVQAVNNHDDLVSALKELVEQCQWIPKGVFTVHGKKEFQNILSNAATTLNNILKSKKQAV